MGEGNTLQLQVERFVFCIVIFFLITLVIYEGEQPSETIFVPEDIASHDITSPIEPSDIDSPLAPSETTDNLYQYEAQLVGDNKDCGDDATWIGIHYLPETCMMEVLRNDSCNHFHFVHGGDKNCKCITPLMDCSKQENVHNRRATSLYKIWHANMTKLDHALTRVALGDDEITFRRFRPGENTSISIVQYKRPWTPYKVHLDSYPFCHVSKKHKVVYMKSPKAGSSLFSWFMSDALGSMFAHCIYDWDDPQRRIYVDTRLDNANGTRIYLDDYIFFASVRDPLTRFISGFKESSRRVKSAGGRGGISPLEKANFYQYKNLSHFINGVYNEDFSKVYDIHLHEQIGMLLLSRHRMSYIIRLEHAHDDWETFQNLFPNNELPPITEKYLGRAINGKNLAKDAFGEMDINDIRKACWSLRREYCALSYPLPAQCADLFSCVEIQAGEHNVFMPEPDVQARIGDFVELLVYPQDLLQIHLNSQNNRGRGL